jgi:hypothetical protein
VRSGTDDVRVWSGVSATRQHVRRALTRRLGPFSRHVYYVACALLDRVLSSVFSFFNMCCRPRPGVCSETDHFSLAALSACGEGVHLNPRAVSQGLPYSLIPTETERRSVGHRSSLLFRSGSHAGLFSFGHGRAKRFSRLAHGQTDAGERYFGAGTLQGSRFLIIVVFATTTRCLAQVDYYGGIGTFRG